MFTLESVDEILAFAEGYKAGRKDGNVNEKILKEVKKRCRNISTYEAGILILGLEDV